jgi:serine/threonine-protein kinase
MEGTTVGPYRIIEALTDGVYRAHDEQARRDVAVKVLAPARVAAGQASARLLHDAGTVVALQHPHICALLGAGEHVGAIYIAMELIDGQSLDRLIAHGELADSDVVTYGLQMADAVAHAHQSGVWHGALDTSRIMVTRNGDVKVLGFGMPGAVGCASPEQLRGERPTAASDVWGLGVALFEMASGHRPFAGSTTAEVEAAILEQRPRALPPSVHSILRGIISRCLAKDPRHRYPSAGELSAALAATRRAAFEPSHHPAAPSPVPPRGIGLRTAAGVGAVILVTLAAMAIVASRGCDISQAAGGATVTSRAP